MKRLAVLCFIMLLTAPLAAEDGVKFIMGFETAELEAKMRDTWTHLNKRDNGCDFWAHFEYGAEDSHAWTWRCREGESTEGKQALTTFINQGRRQRSFQPTEFLSYYYPMLRERAEASIVMNTFQWLGHAAPELRDWTGYDRLWVDFKADKPLHVWLSVEDRLIEPPVVRTFDTPADKWVTLELNLADAKAARGLDLANMANIYLLARAEEGTAVRVDNVRVVKAGVVAKLDVLRDDAPMKLPESGFPEKPVVPKLDADYTPDRTPVTLEPARKIADGSIVPFGFIAAADNRRLLLGCTQGRNRWSAKATILESKDGGETWEPLLAPNASNFDHGTARGSVIDALGDVTCVSSGPGCSGIGVPSPRQHLTKYTFNGLGWERRQWASILDSDIRHCGSAARVTRLPRGEHAGRLWATWGAVDRLRQLVVHCRYSDDDGLTWWHDGSSAMVPDSAEKPLNLNSYSYQQPRITYFRGHAAVVWQDERGLRWSWYDGAAWKPAQAIDLDAKAVLAVTEDESFRIPGSVVTVGESDIFMTAWNRKGVFHYDGKTWKRELPDADDAGALTICGGTDVMLITMGHTEQPPPVKRIEITREARVQCYRRRADGTWDGPLDLSGGEVTLHEYRQMTSLVVPPASPPNFAPVCFSSNKEIKLVKVPVLTK